MRKSIVDVGWEGRAHDECLQFHGGSDGEIAVLSMYVDDVLKTENDQTEVRKMVGYLLGKYEGRDLGVPGKIVGITHR